MEKYPRITRLEFFGQAAYKLNIWNMGIVSIVSKPYYTIASVLIF